MTISSIASQTQAGIRVHGQIDTFFNRFRIGTLLHRCGIRKRHGHSVRSLTQAIFTLPFVGQNFYRGIVINPDQPFGKDAAYDLLKGVRHNWRKLILVLARRIFSVFNRLTDENRESVLILDDSTYDRSRSKTVELLSRVYDHSTGTWGRGTWGRRDLGTGGTWGRPLFYLFPFSKSHNPTTCAIFCPLLADWLMVGFDNFNFLDSSMVVITNSRVAQ